MSGDAIELIPEIMRFLQKETAESKRALRHLHDDVRAGFASIRSELETVRGDIRHIETRLDRLEDEFSTMKKIADFPSE